MRERERERKASEKENITIATRRQKKSFSFSLAPTQPYEVMGERERSMSRLRVREGWNDKRRDSVGWEK